MQDDNTCDRVIEALRREVAARGPGARLPGVRALTARLHVSPLTVQRAMSALAREGLVETQPGRGTFVTAGAGRRRGGSGGPGGSGPGGAGSGGLDPGAGDLGWQAVALGSGRVSADPLAELLQPPPAGAVPLAAGYPDRSLQPLALLATAAARAARRPGAWDRIPPAGLPELRSWFAQQVGGGATAHEVVIAPGGQAALSAALRALGAPGAPVLVEAPTYLGAVVAARAAGLRPVPVPSDRDGVRPDLLAAAFAASGSRLLYCQPLFANPHGAVLAPGRRAAVLAAVRAAGAFLIEDDWARDLAIDLAPPPPLAAEDGGGHVVYVRSLTKAAAPGLRVAAVVARGAAAARIAATRIVDDFFVPGPLQETALELVAAPGWRRHRRRLAAALGERRDALAAAVARHLPEARLELPRGGMHLWLGLPEAVDEVALAAAAARAGVMTSPGRHWFPAEPPGPFLRLSYAGAPGEALAGGVEVLARTLAASQPK